MRRLTLLAALFAALFAVAGLAPAAEAAPRPLVVILADPTGTEAPDLLAPYAVLAESGAVDVKIAAPTAQRIQLMPGKAWVAPQMTLEALAKAHPGGPDVVIVPGMMMLPALVRRNWATVEPV